MNRKRALTALSLVFVLLFAAGCASRSKDSANAEYSEQEAPAAAPCPEPCKMEELNGVDTDIPAGEAGGLEDSGGGAPNYGGHKVIATYEIEIKTDEFELSSDMLRNKALELEGYIQSSDVSGTKPETYNDRGRRAYFAFRIPTKNVSAFLDFANGAGVITSSSCSTEDVTLNYFDLETRLEVLHTELDRLKSILVKTDDLADVIQLEQAIADVTLKIEQYTTKLRRYDDLIDYATVYVGVSENRISVGPASRDPLGRRISDGFAEGLAGAGAMLENGLVWFISALPALILLAIAALIVFAAARLVKTARAKRGGRRDEKSVKRRERMAAIAKGEEEKNEGERKE